jgi:hypothetical protein
MNYFINKGIVVIVILISYHLSAQQVATLEYNGGGDWYANPTAVPNLIQFSNEYIHTKIDENPTSVKPNSIDLFNYPIVFITGHGNILFNEESAENLRNYLINGGFLHISDNYGMDKYLRKAFKSVFPELDFEEVPYNHPIYHQTFDFDTGIPKIHEHDGKRPIGYGLFYKGKLVCFYDYESDLSDGWESASVHHDPAEVRLKALQMGANIIEYAFSN